MSRIDHVTGFAVAPRLSPVPDARPGRRAAAPALWSVSRPGRVRRAAGRAGCVSSGLVGGQAVRASRSAREGFSPSSLDRLADLGGDARRVDAQDAPQVGGRCVVDELGARQTDRAGRAARAAADRPSRRRPAARARPEPNPPLTTLSSSVTTSFLPRACSKISSRVERLGVAGVDDRDRPTLLCQRVGRLHAAHDDGPKADDEQVACPRAGPRPGRPESVSGSTAGRSRPESRG